MIPQDARQYPGDNRYWVTRDGKIFSAKWKTPRELSQFRLNKSTDYQCVGTTRDGKVHKRYVHRMVAETYLPRPAGCTEVNHIDHDKTNNHVENLEWVSRTENMQKAHEFHNGIGVCKR